LLPLLISVQEGGVAGRGNSRIVVDVWRVLFSGDDALSWRAQPRHQALLGFVFMGSIDPLPKCGVRKGMEPLQVWHSVLGPRRSRRRRRGGPGPRRRRGPDGSRSRRQNRRCLGPHPVPKHAEFVLDVDLWGTVQELPQSVEFLHFVKLGESRIPGGPQPLFELRAPSSPRYPARSSFEIYPRSKSRS